MTRSLAPALLAAGALLAGCGSAAPTSSSSAAVTVPSAAAPVAAPSTAAGAGSVAPAPSSPGSVPALTGDPTDLTRASQAGAGAGAPPTTLLTHDVVVGKGRAAKAADTVTVRYSGTLWTDGSLFDASWTRGTDPISFSLTEVVPGFTQGITGMRAGGRRVIVIPPELGYGDQPQAEIPANSTLVFVVDLVSIG